MSPDQTLLLRTGTQYKIVLKLVLNLCMNQSIEKCSKNKKKLSSNSFGTKAEYAVIKAIQYSTATPYKSIIFSLINFLIITEM